ncbi:S28 family serine protease [Streptomyces sp. 549]|uniref:S28 family serine protease n=1 Tax=Streptomyces sp. 549 TaxID=3049076 RepID=UPI0024C37BEC|nr:S28 family serine protease [Streptomyces sp. 549]MDK1476126.1 S28 family serine protease [Streptomyces sp. 549]
MRRSLAWVLSLVVLISTLAVGTASAGAATAAGPDGQAATSGAEGTNGTSSTDIKDRLLAIRGMSLIEEKPVDGYRFFVLNFEQPVDHRKPRRGTFKQRITVLHRADDRPTVFFTSGYGLNTNPARSEPTRMVDGNQVSMEYRYFAPSRPDTADWRKLDIWQAASDQHRIFTALRGIYSSKWVSTGGSKGGMTATYYRRFYPRDMAGTVAYVAPNNVDNNEDSAYDRFFASVGSAECRARLATAEREAFLRRGEIVDRYAKWAQDNNLTFTLYGSADRAYEVLAMDVVYAFWQYQGENRCATVPGADATTDELYDWIDATVGFDFGTDQGLLPYSPYFYQAGTQLGWPSVSTTQLDGLLRYPGIQHPRNAVPREIPMPRFDRHAMRDIDRWVQRHSSQMLFVNGENDPWRAEPFRVGERNRDAKVFTAPGANHGANIAQLADDDRAQATRMLLRWVGIDVTPASPAARSAAPQPLAAPDPALDAPMTERRPPALP